MTRETYAYRFGPEADMQDAQEALLLAAAAAEGLYGRSRVQLEAAFECDAKERSAAVAGGTEVGQAIARVFTVLLAGTVGEEAFTVERTAGNDDA